MKQAQSGDMTNWLRLKPAQSKNTIINKNQKTFAVYDAFFFHWLNNDANKTKGRRQPKKVLCNQALSHIFNDELKGLSL